MQVELPQDVKENLELGQKQKQELALLPSRNSRRAEARKSLRSKKAAFFDPVRRAQQTLLNRMTNWQRHQWARAGRPMDKLDYFATLTKEIRNATI